MALLPWLALSCRTTLERKKQNPGKGDLILSDVLVVFPFRDFANFVSYFYSINRQNQHLILFLFDRHKALRIWRMEPQQKKKSIVVLFLVIV